MRSRESWPSHAEVYAWAENEGLFMEQTSLDQLAGWLVCDYDEVLRLYLSKVGTFRNCGTYEPPPTSAPMRDQWDAFFVFLVNAIEGAPQWLEDETIRHWVVQRDLWEGLSPFDQARVDRKYNLLRRMRSFFYHDEVPMELP